eukprot:13772643-Heterocapsa_arctica.AAC.1
MGSCVLLIVVSTRNEHDMPPLPEGCHVHIHEVYSGAAVLTLRAQHYYFLTADPIDHRTGWNCHQKRLDKLYDVWKP